MNGLVVVALVNIILGGGGRQVLRCGQDRTRGTPPIWWGEKLTCARIATRALTFRVILTSPRIMLVGLPLGSYHLPCELLFSSDSLFLKNFFH